MGKRNRRAFLQTSTVALAAGFSTANSAFSNSVPSARATSAPSSVQIAQALSENEGKKPLRLGLILGIGRDPDAAMSKVHELGLPTCQVFVDEIEPEIAGRLRQALSKYGIEATSLVVGGPGKEVWDFYQGPLTIGLVPRDSREARMAHIKKASDLAKQ